jgi:hypothetical protein
MSADKIRVGRKFVFFASFYKALVKRVIDFVTRLSRSAAPRRKDGEKLAKLAGLLTHEEAEELKEIINANCERIDNEW